MKKKIFCDILQITDVGKMTKDGYLVVEADCARSGIQVYSGRDLNVDQETVRIYRPHEAVFDEKSLQSYAWKPVTDNHPKEFIDPNNWRDFAVGFTGDKVVRDGDHIRVQLMINDQNVIDKIRGGKREISMGYHQELRYGQGKTADGETYDAVAFDFSINHLAIVDKGRAGHECRIIDLFSHQLQGSKLMPETRTVTIDGLPVQTDDTGAKIVEKLIRDHIELQKTSKESLAAKDKELAKKDADLDKLKKEKEDMEKKVLTPDAIDTMVKDRASLMADAMRIAPNADLKGLTVDEIKRKVVISARGEDCVKDKTQDYINARYDILLDDAPTSGVLGDSMSFVGGQLTSDKLAKAAQDEREDYTKNAWSGKFDGKDGK